MDAAADRPEFEPPQEHSLWRGFAFAVAAHLLLALGLTQAVQWQRVSHEAAVEAELWSSLPRQAAPRPVEAPPPPPPAPVVQAPPAPEPPVQRDAEIALEREKQRLEAEKRRQEELERERAEARRLEEAEKKRQEELARRKRQEEELARRKEEEARQLAEAKRKEEERRRREQAAREAREAERRAQLREENMRRMQGMAGTGAPSATGTAAQSTGPSAGWGARVQARVRPNIVFTDRISGNPRAEVEVRSAPDGTIIARRLVRSSGVKAWDEAVLRALDKTETLPRDVDGRVPSPVVIEFRPKG